MSARPIISQGVESNGPERGSYRKLLALYNKKKEENKSTTSGKRYRSDDIRSVGFYWRLVL